MWHPTLHIKACRIPSQVTCEAKGEYDDPLASFLAMCYLCGANSVGTYVVGELLLRASPPMDNKIKCLSLAVCFLATPPIKLELGTTFMWGLLNSKPPGPNLMIDNQKY
jgi:hypothetical protein